jgi:hypothetical protein
MKTPKSDHIGKSTIDKPGPSHEEIARRAYQLWEERGKPHGSHEEDWYRAQHELLHQSDTFAARHNKGTLRAAGGRRATDDRAGGAVKPETVNDGRPVDHGEAAAG